MARPCFEMLPLEIVRQVLQGLLHYKCGCDRHVPSWNQLTGCCGYSWRNMWRLRLVNRTFAHQIRLIVFDSDIFLYPMYYVDVPMWQLLAEYLQYTVNSPRKKKERAQRVSILIREIAEILSHHHHIEEIPRGKLVSNLVNRLCEESAKVIHIDPVRSVIFQLKADDEGAQNYAITAAASVGDAVALKELLNLAYPITEISSYFGSIWEAAVQGGLPTLEILLNAGVLSDRRLKKAQLRDALGMAAFYGQLDVIKFLASEGMVNFGYAVFSQDGWYDGNVNNRSYSIVLEQAVKGNQKEIVDFLIEVDNKMILEFPSEGSRALKAKQLPDQLLSYSCRYDRPQFLKMAMERGASMSLLRHWCFNSFDGMITGTDTSYKRCGVEMMDILRRYLKPDADTQTDKAWRLFKFAHRSYAVCSEDDMSLLRIPWVPTLTEAQTRYGLAVDGLTFLDISENADESSAFL